MRKTIFMALLLLGMAGAANAQVFKNVQTIVDRNGLTTLDNCPTVHPQLSVKLNDDNNKLTIYNGEEVFQVLTDEDGFATDISDGLAVHYLDANFDGYCDIFVGQGQSRTYSTLLIWDKSIKQFKRIGTLGEPSLQNFTLKSDTKSVFQGGSNSWCSYSYDMSKWVGNKLKVVESLVVVTEPKEFTANEVKYMFTLKKEPSKRLILATNHKFKLPKYWQEVIY